jgi:hypothetical protein
MSQQTASARKGNSSGRVSSLPDVDPTVPFTPSIGLLTPASSPFANSKTTQESQSELENQLQALLCPSRDVLSSIEPDRHSSVLVYSNVPSSVQFDTHIDTSFHQIVSVEPVDEHRSSDMTLSVSTNGLRLIVRSCVKKQLFRRVKFFHDELHGSYDTETNSVCGLVMLFCNISAIAAEPRWWFDMKPIIKKTHTDHRNNCIKAMRTRFRGEKYVLFCDEYFFLNLTFINWNRG